MPKEEIPAPPPRKKLVGRMVQKGAEKKAVKQTVLQVASDRSLPMDARVQAASLISDTQSLRDMWTNKALPKEVRLAAVENPHFLGENVLKELGAEGTNPIKELVPSPMVINLVLAGRLKKHVLEAAIRTVNAESPPVPLREEG
jgi:hypothetical protein